MEIYRLVSNGTTTKTTLLCRSDRTIIRDRREVASIYLNATREMAINRRRRRMDEERFDHRVSPNVVVTARYCERFSRSQLLVILCSKHFNFACKLYVDFETRLPVERLCPGRSTGTDLRFPLDGHRDTPEMIIWSDEMGSTTFTSGQI